MKDLTTKKSIEATADVLLENIADIGNLRRAWNKLRSRKDSAAGVDNMNVYSFGLYGEKYLYEIRDDILKRKYNPSPNKRIYIPKGDYYTRELLDGQYVSKTDLNVRCVEGPNTRPLSIPTIRDRIVLLAIKHIIEPLFDPYFSKSSYAFRAKSGSSDSVYNTVTAAQAASRMIKTPRNGNKLNRIIDPDISKFFNNINRNKLLGKMRGVVKSKGTMDLIRTFIGVGYQENGEVIEVAGNKGIPQGSPISPLLANIYLDEIDKKLEKSGTPFIRYADDILIFASSDRAAKDVNLKLKDMLRGLDLEIKKENKETIMTPDKLGYVGFNFTEDGAIIAGKEKIESMKNKARAAISEAMNEKIRGMLNYYDIATNLDEISKAIEAATDDEHKAFWEEHRVRQKHGANNTAC